MPAIDDRALFTALATLKADWPGSAWSYDGRMSCYASSFGAPLAARAREVALVALPSLYTGENLASAPPALAEVAKRAGGLRSGQLLFNGGSDERSVFGLWWPWSGGATITLRLGFIGLDPADEAQARLRDLLVGPG